MRRSLLRRGLLTILTGLVFAAQASAQRPDVERVRIGEQRQQIEGWGASIATWVEPSVYADPRWLALWRDLGLNVLRINLSKDVLADAAGRLDRPVPIVADIDANIERMNFRTGNVSLFAGHARWLRDNALEPERVLVVGSLWSPPHWMKGPTGFRQTWVDGSGPWPTPWLAGDRIDYLRPGTGDSIGGRLRTEDPAILQAYGRYIAAWVEGFEREYGIALHAISIQNESLFENPFDSMVVTTGADGEEDFAQYALLLDSVRRAWHEYGLTVRIKGPHPAHIGPTPDNPWSLLRTARVIDAVARFDAGDLLGFLDYFNTNYYMPPDAGGAAATAGFFAGKANVAADWAGWAYAPGVRQYGRPVWISESGGESVQWAAANARSDAGAQAVAVKIFNALTHADAVSYLYWVITDAQDTPAENSLLGLAQLDNPLQSAKYAAYRHFSRFIRPGAVRLETAFEDGGATLHGASPYDALHGLSVAAFAHPQDRKLTIVALNMTAQTRRFAVDLPAEYSAAEFSAWRSDADARFEALSVEQGENGSPALALPPGSIATLQADY